MSDKEGITNPSYKKENDSDSWPEEDQGTTTKGTDSTAVAVEMDKSVVSVKAPVAADYDDDDDGELEDVEPGRYTEEEEKILDVLREVVRKCTNPNPMKRPTAAEVLDMLNKCPVTVNEKAA